MKHSSNIESTPQYEEALRRGSESRTTVSEVLLKDSQDARRRELIEPEVIKLDDERLRLQNQIRDLDLRDQAQRDLAAEWDGLLDARSKLIEKHTSALYMLGLAQAELPALPKELGARIGNPHDIFHDHRGFENVVKVSGNILAVEKAVGLLKAIAAETVKEIAEAEVKIRTFAAAHGIRHGLPDDATAQ